MTGTLDDLRTRAARELAAWLQATYGAGSWLETPLGRWEPHVFEYGVSGKVLDDLEGWPPFSWEPLDQWLQWIEETKSDTSLPHHERQMLLLNALAVLEGRLADTLAAERVVSAALAEMRQARKDNVPSHESYLLIDYPTPFTSLARWLAFVESMRAYDPKGEMELPRACRIAMTKIAAKRAAEPDSGLVETFWF